MSEIDKVLRHTLNGERKPRDEWHLREERGHQPGLGLEGWRPGVRGGYRPVTSDAGAPPTGGSGGKEPEPKK